MFFASEEKPNHTRQVCFLATMFDLYAIVVHFVIKVPLLYYSNNYASVILIIVSTGPKSKEEKQKESEEQQKVIELKIKMRNEEIEQDRNRKKERESLTLSTANSPPTTTATTTTTTTTTTTSSSTQRETTTLVKVRSEEIEGFDDPMVQEAIRLSLLESGESTVSVNRKDLLEDENKLEVHDLDEDEELNLAIQLSLGINVK